LAAAGATTLRNAADCEYIHHVVVLRSKRNEKEGSKATSNPNSSKQQIAQRTASSNYNSNSNSNSNKLESGRDLQLTVTTGKTAFHYYWERLKILVN
jgi:hypothetical protein